MAITPTLASEFVANTPDLVLEILKASTGDASLAPRLTSKLFKEAFDFHHARLYAKYDQSPLISRYLVKFPTESNSSKIKSVKLAELALTRSLASAPALSIEKAAELEEARNLIEFYDEIKSRAAVLTLVPVADLELPVLGENLIENANQARLWLSSHQEILDQFTFIDLSNRELTSVPKEISLLRNVEEIILSFNKIVKFPQELLSLSRLRDLELFHNELRFIPDEIPLLQSLEKLSLGQNKIESLPDSITTMHHVRELDVSRNRITALPENLSSMKHLREFHAASNLITELPADMGNMHGLLRLDLSNNLIVIIPDDFCEMASIEYLNLSRNYLTGLPDNFGNLSYLNRLNLSFNLFTELPVSVWEKAKYLEGFKLFSNPLDLALIAPEFHQYIDGVIEKATVPKTLDFSEL